MNLKCDRLVNLLETNGIKILGIFHYNVSWESPKSNTAPNPELFANYVRHVFDRYNDRIKYREIWNEPDSPVYWEPQHKLVAYTHLLKTVYPVIKQTDPTSKVLLGGLSTDHPFNLKKVYRNGGKDYFDIVNIHPVVDSLDSAAMNSLRGIHRSSAHHGSVQTAKRKSGSQKSDVPA